MVELRQINPCISIGILHLGAYGAKEGIQIKRDLEKAGTRYLVGKLLQSTDFELHYTPDNKPFIADHPGHISISHSHDKLVVILNVCENTGIDIELIRDKVLKVTHKFLNAGELAFAGADVEKLITLWAAKEALYKTHGIRGIDFITHLFIDDFEGPCIRGAIKTDAGVKSYSLISERIDNYIMVYTQHEIQ